MTTKESFACRLKNLAIAAVVFVAVVALAVFFIVLFGMFVEQPSALTGGRLALFLFAIWVGFPMAKRLGIFHGR